jgi:hypothetical protein
MNALSFPNNDYGEILHELTLEPLLGGEISILPYIRKQTKTPCSTFTQTISLIPLGGLLSVPFLINLFLMAFKNRPLLYV